MDAIVKLVWRPESGMEWKVDATVMFAWRPESRMEWKWTPLPCLRGVQNRGLSGNGRHCHVCVASRIGGGVESGRPYYVGVASKIGGGVESGLHCHVGVASRIWNGVEMDAIVMFAWRPESRLKRNRTPPPSHLASSAKIAAIPDAFSSAASVY